METIKRTIKEKGMTVTEFINKAGIQRDSYYKYVRGERKPSINMLKKMCDALELDILEVTKEFI